jgi:methyl-accepting chemotaxis protein
VVKVATDVTDQKLNSADFAGHIDAIGKSQTVIEFNMDGTIGTANANFLDALVYSLGEITGKHHSPFVEASERDSAGYREFWNGLAFRPANTNGSARVARRSGFRPPTIRSSI